jgi:hypothetical protein
MRASVGHPIPLWLIAINSAWLGYLLLSKPSGSSATTSGPLRFFDPMSGRWY